MTQCRFVNSIVQVKAPFWGLCRNITTRWYCITGFLCRAFCRRKIFTSGLGLGGVWWGGAPHTVSVLWFFKPKFSHLLMVRAEVAESTPPLRSADRKIFVFYASLTGCVLLSFWGPLGLRRHLGTGFFRRSCGLGRLFSSPGLSVTWRAVRYVCEFVYETTFNTNKFCWRICRLYGSEKIVKL